MNLHLGVVSHNHGGPCYCCIALGEAANEKLYHLQMTENVCERYKSKQFML